MPPIRTDLNAGSNFEVKPAGDYDAAVFSFKRDVSNGAKTKGATTINVRYKLEDGGSVFDTYIIHPTTTWKFKQLLTAAGIPGDELQGEATIGYRDEFEGYEPEEGEAIIYIDDMLERIHGERVTVRLKIQEQRTDPETGRVYEKRNQIDRILPVGGGASDNTLGWG
jgi:hypothetical protein